MRAIVGAILIVGGSVLIAAGIIADGVNRGQGGHGTAGYVLGGFVGVVGMGLLVGGALKRAWDAIPVDEKKPSQPE
jgi:hypothetical protein